jgi:antagonist of KipI
MEMRVIRAGMLTTVQDLGRRGHLAEGVPAGGAADPFAFRVANLLVGNPEDAPALEITLTGPELEFAEAAWVAVCGARFDEMPSWRPFRVEQGGRVRFGRRLQGCRGYLSVSGGIDVEPALGGRGTFLAARLGGCATATSSGPCRRRGIRPATGASMSGSSRTTRTSRPCG